MKETLDYKTVPDRVYHYLLDWNETNKRKAIFEMFGLIRLCDLTKAQILELFKVATKHDIEEMETDI